MIFACLKAWWRSGIKPGYCYRAIETYGGRLGGDRIFPARLPNGCRVSCDLRDEVQRIIWFFGVYEQTEAFLFSRLLKPGMVVVDGGANIGQYTLLAATGVGPGGSVHAFEPIPETFARLERNVADNGLTNVHLNRVALWKEEATLKFGLSERFVGKNSGGFRVREQAETDTIPFAIPVEVAATTLDGYVESCGLDRVDLIKLDVEATESLVLAGARRTLERSRPLILVEIIRSAETMYNANVEALWENLTSLGYSAWRVGSTPSDSGPASGFGDFEKANYILHHGPRPEILTTWDPRQVSRWARRAEG